MAEAASLLNFDDSIRIDASKRLPQYDIGSNKAYRAESKNGTCYALVCEKHTIPRQSAASSYKAIINPHLTTLLKHGPFHWPAAGEERYVFIYGDNPGTPILKVGEKLALDWKHDKAAKLLVEPLILILKDFRDKDFVHGNLRLSNMFLHNVTEKNAHFILGECLSTPGSSAQPSIYEPIERAMADPVARGAAMRHDDMYAFGVSLAIAMRSHDPLHGLSTTDIIKQKIEKGSYAALIGNERIRGAFLELLRGLLLDDPGQRWDMEEVLSWADGQRLTPKQAVKRKKAPRPLLFGNKKFFMMTKLAMAMGEEDTAEAQRIVEDDSLFQWLSRSMEDEEALERVEHAVKSARDFGQEKNYEDRLAANLSIALDPDAPIRYKGLRMAGGGIGTMLAEAMILKKDVNPIVQMLSQNIAMNWVLTQNSLNLDINTLISRFDACRNFLRQTKMGMGIERCLYTLCPECPCLSEKLKGYYVTSPESMMFAFEDLCKKGRINGLFIDRHIAAFLSVKDPKVIDGYLYEINTDEEHRKILGNLKCLASIQKRSNLPEFPAIASSFLSMLPVIYGRYHDQTIKNKLKKSINDFAKSGSLVKIAGLLDNPEVIEKDLGAFQTAMKEYKDLQKEYDTLEFRLQDKSTFGVTTGRELAAVVSGFISFILIVFTFFMFLTNKSVF
ncbi:MAG: hypothetical protein KDJ75_03305 [Alphaproteobacteria bacterium]|nr:hypothetical protein [Alphaproteobacteria bacterium]